MKIKEIFSEKRTALIPIIIAVIGIILVFASGSNVEKKTETLSADETETYVASTELKLKNIISAITGEEDPGVMVTLNSGSRYIYAADEKKSEKDGGNDVQAENNYITLRNSGGGQDAVIITEILPEIKGVVVVSRYSEDPVISASIIKAVKTVLDLSTTEVCVVAKSD